MIELKSIWKELGFEVRRGEGWLTRRIFLHSVCPIYATVSCDSGMPGLLLEVNSASVPVAPEYPSGHGFAVLPVPHRTGPRGVVWLVLTLTEPRYLEVFESLAENVAHIVSNASNEKEGVRAFLARLRIWQEFMRRHGTKGLSREEQTGLFSELVFMFTRMLPIFSAHDCVSCWKGPGNGLHDFVACGISLEIKGTTFMPASTFKVSHIAQLDETQVDRLILCHYAWSLSETTGTSLPELVDKLRNRLGQEDTTALNLFNELLMQAGYLDAQTHLYQRHYQQAHELFFKVSDGFPRLRVSDLPPGVADCSYLVELSACHSWSIVPEQLFELFPEGP